MSLGLPNLPIVGDLGTEPVKIGGDLLEHLPIPPALQDLIKPKPKRSPTTGLTGLLGLLGGQR